MKTVECANTPGDFVAWFKYKVSYEEKAVRFIAIAIIACTLVSLVANYTQNWGVLAITLALFGIVVGSWCFYTRSRLERELASFEQTDAGRLATVRFVRQGVQVERDGERAYYPFEQVRKAREIPWYLFLFVDDGPLPLIVDKTKIETVSDALEPYYIAKKLRELSPDYKYLRESDLTYTGKYSKLVHR